MSHSQHLANGAAIRGVMQPSHTPMLDSRTSLDPRPVVQAIGVDLVDIQRLQEVSGRWGEHLLARLFTDQERALCRGASGYRWKSLAGRFAAKEAMKKVLAAHGESVGWVEIEVVNGVYGEPLITLYGRAQSAAQRLGYTGLLLSISHDAGLAIATVVVT
jgi:holo-[acyl-carrier protein] synthase